MLAQRRRQQHWVQGISQEMIKGSPNLLIVWPGRDLGSSHNAIWWNLAIFFYVQAEIRPSKRRLDGSLAKSLIGFMSCVCWECPRTLADLLTEVRKGTVIPQ